jgi:type II secretory pathway component GspD/PulD (secretin)
MKLFFDGRGMTMTKVMQGMLVMVLVLGGTQMWAQKDVSAPKEGAEQVQQTYYLNNSSQVNDGNEIVTAIRNILPVSTKVYFVPAQNAIVVGAVPAVQAQVQKLLTELDRPKKSYRLTYTITEMDNGKRIGTQHFSMVVIAGQRTTLKQGSKVPVLTGNFNTGTGGGSTATPGVQTQFTYLDVGMNFDASLDEFTNGVRLRSKVEQSSIAEDRSMTVGQHPVVRQTVLEGTSFLSVGKPLMLGSVDVPGSTRHQDIDVVLDTVK